MRRFQRLTPCCLIHTVAIKYNFGKQHSLTYASYFIFQLKSIDASKITFKSNFLGTFGINVFVVSPEMIDLQEFMVNFEDRVTDAPHVLAVIISLFALTVIMIIILRRLDTRDQIMVSDQISDSAMWQSDRLAACPGSHYFFVCFNLHHDHHPQTVRQKRSDNGKKLKIWLTYRLTSCCSS